MLTKLPVSVVFLVSPAYAGACGEINGTVRCTDDVEQNCTLQPLDTARLTPSGGSALSDLKSQGLRREPSQPKFDQEQESNKITFQSWGRRGVGLDAMVWSIRKAEETSALQNADRTVFFGTRFRLEWTNTKEGSLCTA